MKRIDRARMNALWELYRAEGTLGGFLERSREGGLLNWTREDREDLVNIWIAFDTAFGALVPDE